MDPLILALIYKICWTALGSCTLYGGVLALKTHVKLASAELGGRKDSKRLLGDCIQLSKNFSLNLKTCFEHILIVAPTGAGKTSSEYMPNLLQDKIKGSIILTDTKGELYEKTHKYQESIGRRCILYKPMEDGISYNPLSECKNDMEIMQLAQNLLINGGLTMELMTGKKGGNDIFVEMAQSLLCATLMYCKTIPEALRMILNSDSETIEQLLSNGGKNVQEQFNIFKTSMESPKTMSSIKITFATKLQLFISKLSILQTDFTAEDLRKEPIALYISYPANKAIYLSPYMACFFSQFIDHLIDSKGLPVYLFLDEFANIGLLSNFANNIATARSSEICFMICLQSITQLKQIYGDSNAKSILNNTKCKVILPGLSDLETLNYISALCGFTEVKIDDRLMTKSLFTADEVRRLKDNTALLIMDNKLPIVDNLNIYYNQKKYLNNL